MPLPDDGLVERAALALLATVSPSAGVRGGLVGESFVDADILGEVVQQVTRRACERFRSTLLARCSDIETAIVESELDRTIAQVEAVACEMFPQGRVLH
jgi:hypothetical protein